MRKDNTTNEVSAIEAFKTDRYIIKDKNTVRGKHFTYAGNSLARGKGLLEPQFGFNFFSIEKYRWSMSSRQKSTLKIGKLITDMLGITITIRCQKLHRNGFAKKLRPSQKFHFSTRNAHISAYFQPGGLPSARLTDNFI
ncbi:hypothetical protein ACFE04_021549 [Oxalis oulophora]